MGETEGRKACDLERSPSRRRSAPRNSPLQSKQGAFAQGAGVRLILYLIDTNVISEMRRRKPHGGVVAWLRGLEVGQVFFSAVTFGEIQKGAEITRQQDPVKAAEIEAWAKQLESASPVLPMN